MSNDYSFTKKKKKTCHNVLPAAKPCVPSDFTLLHRFVADNNKYFTQCEVFIDGISGLFRNFLKVEIKFKINQVP